MAERGPPLPKFGEWDVNDPASAEGFTVIFNKARNEKKTGLKSDSPPKVDSAAYNKHGSTSTLGKPHSLFAEEMVLLHEVSFSRILNRSLLAMSAFRK